MSTTVQKLEDARDCLLSVLGPRDGRLHRVLALIDSALDDFWREGDADNGSVPALADDIDNEIVHLDAKPPAPRAG
jgi:hypothetical protein